MRRNKPKQVQNFTWSPELAYAVGLITTDGSLSINNRTVVFTSKDDEQIENFKSILNIKSATGFTINPLSAAYRVQYGNVQFYDWLKSIGLTPKKSLTLGALSIPDAYFRDFLRGHLDGDGSILTYTDFYNTKVNPKYIYRRLWVKFISASKDHAAWLHEKIQDSMGVKGALHITKTTPARPNPMHIIKFGKKESLKLLKQIYYSDKLPCLSRKKGIYLDFINSI